MQTQTGLTVITKNVNVCTVPKPFLRVNLSRVGSRSTNVVDRDYGNDHRFITMNQKYKHLLLIFLKIIITIFYLFLLTLTDVEIILLHFYFLKSSHQSVIWSSSFCKNIGKLFGFSDPANLNFILLLAFTYGRHFYSKSSV